MPVNTCSEVQIPSVFPNLCPRPEHFLNPRVLKGPRGVTWPPRGALAISGDSFGYHSWRGVLLASSGYRPEMLYILRCTGQLLLPYPQHRIICSQRSGELRLSNGGGGGAHLTHSPLLKVSWCTCALQMIMIKPDFLQISLLLF